MKNLITIFMALLCLGAKAQIKLDTIPKIDGQYAYQEVVNIHGAKDELFKKAKVYFVDNFKSANDVIQYQDPVEGKIIGKGYFNISVPRMGKYVMWDVYYSTEVICKDGKYRYRIYDIQIKDIWPGMIRKITIDDG